MKLLVVFVYLLHFAILINAMKLRQGDGEDAPGVVEDDDRVDAGRTTPSSTTTDAGSSSGSGGGGPGNLLDADINAKINHLLEISKTGHYAGNHEFDLYWYELRQISLLGPELAQLKVHAYDRFFSYNALRLKLECDLEKRIAVIDSLLSDKKISARCKEFYQEQKEALKIAQTASNSEKQLALRLQSEPCPKMGNDDDDDDYDSDDCYDWIGWW